MEADGLGKFSSQGLEKKNDILKRFYHARSNKWDSAADSVRLCKRLEDSNRERTKRPYNKADGKYWYEGGIVESRKRRQRISVAPSKRPPDVPYFENMTPGELRTELEALGVYTT
ncbi:hypothetical protein MTO96_029626 [Rhipicephalus appendiculatus]